LVYTLAKRDDELRRALTEANPWWQAAAANADPTAWTTSHRLLRDRARHDLGYRADILADLARAPIGDALVLLTGPRCVGKSVALLDLAAALCRRPDVDPRQVIHVPCDGLRDRDLRRAFTLGRELTRATDHRAGPRRRIWLLDEISMIAGWTAVVKAARDGTPLGDDTLVLTSSQWRPGEDVEGHLLAGRAGAAGLRRVRHLLPLTFRSFLAATRPELVRIEPVPPSGL
jgi:predicted AAA+ superfamily ATPase